MPLNVSIKVPRGDFDVDIFVHTRSAVALTGTSGSGKTTILRAVAGLEPSAIGNISVGDEQWLGAGTNRQASLRRVGNLAQQHGLFPHLTASQNVEYPLLADGVKRKQRRAAARELLASLGLEESNDKSVGQLSGGQCRRVALARAMAAERSVYLLDEPFAGLDEQSADLAEAFIAERLRHFRRPALIAGHNSTRLRRISTELLTVTRGRLIAEPTTRANDSVERAHVSALARSPRSIVRTPADFQESSL